MASSLHVTELASPSSSPATHKGPRSKKSFGRGTSVEEKPSRSLKKRLSRLFEKRPQDDHGTRDAPPSEPPKSRMARCRHKASRYLGRLFAPKGEMAGIQNSVTSLTILTADPKTVRNSPSSITLDGTSPELRPSNVPPEMIVESRDMRDASSSATIDGPLPKLKLSNVCPDLTIDYSLPRHRTATPLSSAIYKGRMRRGLYDPRASEESQENAGCQQPEGRPPERQRSVRFYGVDVVQVDGPGSDYPRSEPGPAGGSSNGSKSSHKLSERMESMSAKLNGGSAFDTVIHRAKARKKPIAPFINTNADVFPDLCQGSNLFAPGSSSAASGRDANSLWSPASTASTAATSFSSPHSLASRYARATPDDVHRSSKGLGNADETTLPPIEEDSRRFLFIPVQDSTTEGVAPSIATVENAAAAKCALELHFNTLLMSGSSPRSVRRKKFEQRMRDLGLSHDERESTRQLWVKSESEHLRQMRVLKSTALTRRETKGTSIAGFDMIRVLGRGSFGVVRLVTERPRPDKREPRESATGVNLAKDDSTTNVANSDGKARRNIPSGRPISDVFAMKVIRKSEMLRSCQEGHLRAERDFLVAAEGSTWVVPLLASFQDNTNLYLVMEYMIGGDFLGMLLREDVLDELVAR